ncbi:MAG: hypothetical protein CMM01_01955 [Rhodopirellula sp.]|nr:hypothetical protein [Rhodopirellula sp.]
MNVDPKDICDSKNHTERLLDHPLQTSKSRSRPSTHEFARENSQYGPRTLHLDHKSSYEQE